MVSTVFYYSPSLRSLSGWGATEESLSGNEQSEWLAQLDITVNNSVRHHYLIETNVGENDVDPCAGDSGGPLLLKEGNGEWVLIGTLLGGGYSCGDGDGQDLTSEWNKISVHAQWIKSVIRGDVLLGKIFWLLNLYRSFRGLKIGCYVFQALLQKIPLNFRLLIFLQ